MEAGGTAQPIFVQQTPTMVPNFFQRGTVLECNVASDDMLNCLVRHQANLRVRPENVPAALSQISAVVLTRHPKRYVANFRFTWLGRCHGNGFQENDRECVAFEYEVLE
jgi:hypothetical protein